MRIGIKYCGGCNARYDRSRCVEQLKERFSFYSFETVSRQQEYDILLLVCGCPAACASAEGIKVRGKKLTLTNMKGFVEAEEIIEHWNGEPDIMREEREEDKRKILRVGAQATFRKTFFRDDCEKFAALTGDRNRMHLDASFSSGCQFGQPVVHGVLAGSLISTVMGMKLPGEGTVFMGEKLTFVQPVYYGDTITALVRFVSCREMNELYVGRFYGECRNQNGEVVIRGVCYQRMNKELFCVENPTERAEEMIELQEEKQ